MKKVIRFLLVSTVLLTLLRIFVLEPYAIPTGSMKPTILEGDAILVDKLPYTIPIPLLSTLYPYHPSLNFSLPGTGELQREMLSFFTLPLAPRYARRRNSSRRTVAIRGD